jgi:hypothetical protein
MKLIAAAFALVLVVAAPEALARDRQASRPGLANATVLIIRHAEDAAVGRGLSPAGSARANAYARYFRPFRLGGERLRIDALVAAADSRASDRARLTLEPLSRSLGIPVEQPFAAGRVGRLARWLAAGAPNRTILIAWHHSDAPDLIAALGGDPQALLGRRHWPDRVYDWVVVLRFDGDGRILPNASRLVREPALLP